jgi:hypothetical protein
LLNEQTRKGLKSLTSVGNAAIVRYPWTSVLQKDKTLIAFINLEEYGEEPFEDFGLENMSEFLSLIDFFKDPEIDINSDGVISIETEKWHQKYATSDLDTMKSFDVKVTTLENISKAPEALSFEISKEEFVKMKKIASLTKATSLIVSPNEKLILGKLDRNNNISGETEIDYPISVQQEVSIVYGMSHIAKLPDRDYTVSIRVSETTGNGISVWEVSDEPIKIVVGVVDVWR